MSYEVKTYKQGRENHFSSYLFHTYRAAMHFINSFREDHGTNWVIELIQEG